MNLFGIDTVGTPGMWLGFFALIFVMLALDLGVFRRKSKVTSLRSALIWSIVWIALSLAFAYLVKVWFGPERAMEFVTGYLIEKALSVDNIFVFVVIFSAFAIPPLYQHRVLFWGIFGALIMRIIFIFAGSALLEKFHWTIYLFGGILIVTGIKLMMQKHGESDPGKNPLVKLTRKFMPVTDGFRGEKFMVIENGRRFATPLLLALVAIEATDVIFAVDSIPAIFAVTRDPFIVFTSNIFAILGLRSLYFLLADIVDRFVYLKLGLSVILIFVGIKMTIVEFVKVPIPFSLGVILGILTISILASLYKTKK